jgi:hypothetical protein
MFKRMMVIAVLGVVAAGCGDSKRRNSGFSAGSGGGLAVTSNSGVNATVGVLLNTQLTASGGTAPVGSWAVVSGALPSGLGLSQNGLLTGTPTATGNTTVVVRVLDSSTPPQSAQQSLTISVGSNPSTPAFATQNGMTQLSFTDSGLLGSSGTSISAGQSGQTFSVVALMGTSSTVRAGERYMVRVTYNVGSMPDARVGVTSGLLASGSGSGSHETFPQSAVVSGTGTIDVYMRVITLTDLNGNPTTARSIDVSLLPNTGGGSSVRRLLTLN